jgi:PhnB protein
MLYFRDVKILSIKNNRSMKLELFINFNGNCREAVAFYAKVFKSVVGNLMTYGQAPPDPNCPISESDRDKVCYAGVPMGDMVVMFCDVPAGSQFVVGNNISPTVSMDNKDEVKRVFEELKEDGEVLMELQQTFFSELFGMVKDKFGIMWQILFYISK